MVAKSFDPKKLVNHRARHQGQGRNDASATSCLRALRDSRRLTQALLAVPGCLVLPSRVPTHGMADAPAFVRSSKGKARVIRLFHPDRRRRRHDSFRRRRGRITGQCRLANMRRRPWCRRRERRSRRPGALHSDGVSHPAFRRCRIVVLPSRLRPHRAPALPPGCAPFRASLRSPPLEPIRDYRRGPVLLPHRAAAAAARGRWLRFHRSQRVARRAGVVAVPRGAPPSLAGARGGRGGARRKKGGTSGGARVRYRRGAFDNRWVPWDARRSD